jgi:cytochrome P450
MHRGYSRSALVPHLPKVIQIIRDFGAELSPDEPFTVFPSFQRLVTEQLGWVMANRPPGEDFYSIRLFLRTMLFVRVLKFYPRMMLWNPAYLRARSRVFRLAEAIVAFHQENPPTQDGRPANLIDDVLAASDENDQPYSDDMLRGSAIGPYVAGMDTVASQMSFLLYNILKHPQVYARVQREVDAAFADGDPTTHHFRLLTTLNGAIQETLRMHPVAPFTPRTAIQSFEFAGYHVQAGSEVFVANTVTHYLPEHYPDPYTFNVDRLSQDGKGERGAFAPYSLGEHLCLGAGLAESLMMISIASLLHHHELELESPDYEVRIQSAPLPNPGKGFKVVHRKRS